MECWLSIVATLLSYILLEEISTAQDTSEPYLLTAYVNGHRNNLRTHEENRIAFRVEKNERKERPSAALFRVVRKGATQNKLSCF